MCRPQVRIYCCVIISFLITITLIICLYYQEQNFEEINKKTKEIGDWVEKLKSKVYQKNEFKRKKRDVRPVPSATPGRSPGSQHLEDSQQFSRRHRRAIPLFMHIGKKLDRDEGAHKCVLHGYSHVTYSQSPAHVIKCLQLKSTVPVPDYDLEQARERGVIKIVEPGLYWIKSQITFLKTSVATSRSRLLFEVLIDDSSLAKCNQPSFQNSSEHSMETCGTSAVVNVMSETSVSMRLRGEGPLSIHCGETFSFINIYRMY